MKEYTRSGADMFVGNVETLYNSLRDTFGHEAAWEFILAFYRGAGSD